eukprot:COSAG05_NODE_894_length_6706_cov_13.114424_4_plen_42_part_00
MTEIYLYIVARMMADYMATHPFTWRVPLPASLASGIQLRDV